MTAPTPIYARATTAAKLLDMPRARFLDLVSRGALPPGTEIAPGELRWYVPDLDAIRKGHASESLQW